MLTIETKFQVVIKHFQVTGKQPKDIRAELCEVPGLMSDPRAKENFAEATGRSRGFQFYTKLYDFKNITRWVSRLLRVEHDRVICSIMTCDGSTAILQTKLIRNSGFL